MLYPKPFKSISLSVDSNGCQSRPSAKEIQLLRSGTCWTQKFTQKLAFLWGIWCLYYRKYSEEISGARKPFIFAITCVRAWFWIYWYELAMSTLYFPCAQWQLNGTAIPALCVLGIVNNRAAVPCYLNCIDFSRSYTLMQGMTYCLGSHCDEILQQYLAGTICV